MSLYQRIRVATQVEIFTINFCSNLCKRLIFFKMLFYTTLKNRQYTERVNKNIQYSFACVRSLEDSKSASFIVRLKCLLSRS